MKKILTTIIAAILALSLFAIPAMADTNENETVTLSVNTVEAVAGGKAVLDLRIKGDYEVNAANIIVEYDAENLEAASVVKGSVLESVSNNSGIYLLDYASAPGEIRLGICMPLNGLTSNGTIFTMHFTVSEDISETTMLPVKIIVKEFTYIPLNGESANVPTTVSNGAITVSPLPVNGNTQAPTTAKPSPEVVATNAPTAKPTLTEPPMTETPSPTEAPISDAPYTEGPTENSSEAPSKNSSSESSVIISEAPSISPEESSTPSSEESAETKVPMPVIICSMLGVVVITVVIIFVILKKEKK